jgi:glycosyltransferase involved in cell wall biosynthesis
MKGISVIICCYNSAQRLQETLKHLANQRVKETLNWEVIVVDNNSTDSTNRIAEGIWQASGHPTSLVSVNEEQQGLSHARDKGMHVAKYDLLLWCDDDNWLCESYVQTAYDIMNSNAKIGALGGWCEAVFEGSKPKWFDQQAHFFAVSKQGRKSGDITLKKGCLYGAGMVLRKSHWLQLKQLGFKHLLTDRIGNKLNSGGDTEYTFALRLIGYRLWFDDRLYFKHFMSQGRLNLKYLSRLRQARTHSNFILWPYLDLLKGEISNKRDLLKYAFKGGSYRFIRQLGALCIGSFEQKQVAIRYFMFVNYGLFHHSTYKRNLLKTRKWLDKTIDS